MRKERANVARARSFEARPSVDQVAVYKTDVQNEWKYGCWCMHTRGVFVSFSCVTQQSAVSAGNPGAFCQLSSDRPDTDITPAICLQQQ